RMQRPPELGHAPAFAGAGSAAQRARMVDPKNPMLVAVKRHWLAPGLQIRAGGMEIRKSRLALDKLKMHQPARRVVDEHQQRALRAAVLEPPVLAAIELHQLANALAPMARLMDARAPLLAVSPIPASTIHHRSVSRPSASPCTSRNFSAARVGPKSQYRLRIIANASSRTSSGLRRLLGRPRRREIRPVAPSLRYAFSSRNT